MSHEIQSFAHGCNCSGAMGKGIAQEFKKRWPTMYKQYKERCTSNLFNLGDVFVWEDSEFTIFNLGTQQSWRSKAKVDAIDHCLSQMIKIATNKEIKKISMPKIGAGLGGLDWEDVKKIIELRFQSIDKISIYVCVDYVANQPLREC